MFIAAWLIILGVLIAFFSGVLDKQYNPNEQINTVVSPLGTEIMLKQNKMGHYVASGLINGKPVVFLLDTGATRVTVPQHLAIKLNLTPGRKSRAMTANGVVTVADTVIKQLSLGGIEFENVSASINPGMKNNEILLGMSVLKELELIQRGEQLTIRAVN